MPATEQSTIKDKPFTVVIHISAELLVWFGDQKPPSKPAAPLALAILEACSEQKHIGITKQVRSRARKRYAEELRVAGIAKAVSGQPFRWADKAALVFFDKTELTSATAWNTLRLMFNADQLDENLAVDVLEDLESWKNVFDQLSYLEINSSLQDPTAANPSPCPETSAVQQLLHWLIGYWQAMGDEPSPRLPNLDDIADQLSTSRIREVAKYVAELGQLLTTRRSMLALASQNEGKSLPAGVSPTLCSHACELQGFENVRGLRKRKKPKHKNVDPDSIPKEVKSAALASINQFARALLFGAVAHRLGRTLDCAAHLVGTYAELEEKSVLYTPTGKPGLDRFKLSIQWLSVLMSYSSAANAAKHRALVQDIAIVTLRRYATYRAELLKEPEFDRQKVDEVNVYADELWEALRPTMHTLSRWASIIEAWCTAAALNKSADELPNPFRNEKAQKLSSSSEGKLRKRLFTAAERGGNAFVRSLSKHARASKTPLARAVAHHLSRVSGNRP